MYYEKNKIEVLLWNYRKNIENKATIIIFSIGIVYNMITL